MVPINYLAVLVAAVVNMVVGSLWYGAFFQKPWMRLSGITQADIEKSKARGMATSYILAFVGSLLMAYILSHFIVFAGDYFNDGSAMRGVSTGFWSWLGFVAPVTLGIVLWEGKSWKLWMINTSYYLVSLMIMGGILSAWM